MCKRRLETFVLRTLVPCLAILRIKIFLEKKLPQLNQDSCHANLSLIFFEASAFFRVGKLDFCLIESLHFYLWMKIWSSVLPRCMTWCAHAQQELRWCNSLIWLVNYTPPIFHTERPQIHFYDNQNVFTCDPPMLSKKRVKNNMFSIIYSYVLTEVLQMHLEYYSQVFLLFSTFFNPSLSAISSRVMVDYWLDFFLFCDIILERLQSLNDHSSEWNMKPLSEMYF